MTEENLKRPDYRKYRWKKGEKIRIILLCAGITGLFAYFFYRSFLALLPMSAVGTLAFWQIGRNKAQSAREELAGQFRECILAVAISLQAGYSVENAFLESRQDMALMYGEDSLICVELDFVRRGLLINISLEEILTDMAVRSGCKEIAEFAQIFALAKRNGGNMSEIIRNSADQIGSRIELRQEIQMLLGGKKMELTVMKVMPFGILLYINMGNPGYFDPLYHNAAGVAIMTGCLGIYLGAYMLGEHIMEGIAAQLA